MHTSDSQVAPDIKFTLKLLNERACIMFDGELFQSAIKMKASAGNLSVSEVAKSKLQKTSPLQNAGRQIVWRQSWFSQRCFF